MNVSIQIPASLSRFLDCLHGPGRRNLFSVAANAIRIEIQNHLRTNAPRRHNSARRLGASPTRLHEKGAARVTSSSTEDHAEVVIPIPGLSRAFHDIEIKPVHARYLTLPINAIAYGHRVGELRRLGWKFFTPPKGHDKEDILFGYRGKGKNKEVKPMYLLRNHVFQAQDHTLLPTETTIRDTAVRAMMSEITRISQGK